MVSTAQGHWCHVLGSVAWQTREMWAAGLRWMEQCVPPHFCPAAQCQGRTSPDPSGVRPVPSHSCCCQERGHRLVKEEVVLEGGRVHGLTQAAWLEPGHPHLFQYSLSYCSHLPCRRFTTALPGRAPRGKSPCLPGLGGRRLLVHSPPCARGWWGTS